MKNPTNGVKMLIFSSSHLYTFARSMRKFQFEVVSENSFFSGGKYSPQLWLLQRYNTLLHVFPVFVWVFLFFFDVQNWFTSIFRFSFCVVLPSTRATAYRNYKYFLMDFSVSILVSLSATVENALQFFFRKCFDNAPRWIDFPANEFSDFTY